MYIYICITLQVPFNIVFHPIILVLLPLFGALVHGTHGTPQKNAAKQSIGFAQKIIKQLQCGAPCAP